MLGLPFLTRLPSFANTKVYVTEVAARIGKLMMVELVEMHSKFVSYYGPDMDGTPKWMEGEKLSKLLSMLQKIGIEDEGNDLAPLMPLYSYSLGRHCSGEALFGHVELLKEGKLFMFPHLYSKGLLAAWKEPCIVFCPDWGLRHGTVVHLLRRWHADKRNLLVLEQGVDADLTLKPFMPAAIQVLECSFLSGIKMGKVYPLLSVLKPKLVLFPEAMKSWYPLKEDAPWSVLYYSKGNTIEVPNTREEFEVRLAANVALGLQPRQLDGTIAVARLRAKLRLSNGQYMLVAPKVHSDDQSKRQSLHWGAVDPGRVLSALQEKGMSCAFGADDDGSAGCERSILVTGPGDALLKITSERTVIYCDDEDVTKQIYDAVGSVCNVI
ncbi:hypothetical protein ACQ4PT_005799 [Festuca glaucescens]